MMETRYTDLRRALMPVPFIPPSPALFELLEIQRMAQQEVADRLRPWFRGECPTPEQRHKDQLLVSYVWRMRDTGQVYPPAGLADWLASNERRTARRIDDE